MKSIENRCYSKIERIRIKDCQIDMTLQMLKIEIFEGPCHCSRMLQIEVVAGSCKFIRPFGLFVLEFLHIVKILLILNSLILDHRKLKAVSLYFLGSVIEFGNFWNLL